MFDQNGLPTIAASKGVFAETDVQNRVLSIETPQVSFAALVDAMLREMDVAATIVIDPVNRRVYAGDAGWVDTATNGDIAHTAASVLQPETGQTGRSLTWETGSDTGAGIPNKAALVAPTAAVKPARSVSSLVSAVLAAMGAIDPAVADADKPMIVVDQEGGLVHLIKPTNRATALSALDSAVTTGTHGVKVTLSEPEGGSSVAPLIFEGGATS